jgi:ferredoxin-NADP reductase
MGMHLARLEMVSLLQSLARRAKTIALAGAPVVAMNNTIRAYASLPVVVHADEHAAAAADAMAQPERETLTVRLAARQVVAQDIVAIELESADGSPLPPFDAGAHVDVQVTGELLRQYSLCNDPAAAGRYRIGVLLDPKSRGGSAAVHAAFHVGQVLEIGRPRNNFPLRMDAAHTLLFAGGIGITPILAMAHALHAAGRSFELHYCGRSALALAFLDELQRFGQRVQVHLDDGPASQHLDINTATCTSVGPTASWTSSPKPRNAWAGAMTRCTWNASAPRSTPTAHRSPCWRRAARSRSRCCRANASPTS